MRQLSVIVFFAFLSARCTTEDELRTTDLSVSEIVGKWKLVESYVSPGGETTWQTIEDGYEITFTMQGDFYSTNLGSCEGEYKLDGDRLTINSKCEDGYNTGQPYTVIIESINATSMEYSYSGCIEACKYRFKKI